MDRRQFLIGSAAMATAFGFTGTAFAEWNPRRPLNIIVPYKAGGGTDLYARALAAAAKGKVRVPFVIVNKPGAGGITGAIAAAGARPDGNTIMLHSTGSFLLRSMLKDSEINPFDSFQTIAQIGNLKGALAVPQDSPFKTAQDVIDAAKADPGKLRWGHNGRGTTFQTQGQTFLNSQGLEAVDVPFKGGAATRAAIIGAQVDFGFIGIQQAKGFDGKMRVLALASEERDEIQPDIPTFKEQGIDIPLITSPIILFAPNGVDPAVIAGMETAFEDIAADPQFAETLKSKGVLPFYRNGADALANLTTMKEAAQPVIDALKTQ